MGEDRTRDSKGRFSTDHGVERTDLLDIMDPLEPYTTRELADKSSIPRRSAYEYLEKLSEEGEIRKKKTEPRRVIWIRPEDG